MSKVSKNLKKIRTEKKLTQDALAEKMHVTRQAISNWENDKTKPDIESLEMLAKVLEVDIEELIYGEKKEVIISQDKTKQKNRIKITLAVVGSIFVASGLAILFFGFWQEFSISLQTAFSVIPMLAGQAVALYTYLKKKDSPSWRESASIIWTIGTVATIALVDGVHNISWSYADYLVIDSVLLIPILFIFGSVVPLAFYYYMSVHIATIGTWQNLLFSLLFFAIGILYTYYLSRDKDDVRGKIAQWITMIASIPQVAVLIYAGSSVDILAESMSVRFAGLLSFFLCVYIVSMDNTVVTSPYKPISAIGICGTMLALSLGTIFDAPNMTGDNLIGFVISIVLYIAIPLVVVAVKREDFEDEPFKIAKIVIPFLIIGLTFVHALVEEYVEPVVSWDTKYLIYDIIYYIGAALTMAFGGMLVYQGVKEIKILTINLGLLTVFAQLLGIYANVGDNNMFIFGGLLVNFGGAIIFINWKMLSIKKSRQEQLNGGGTDA
ncbi:MAG: DUF2157 domain-containing protein [Clostridia bacterium]|nr:DUF2157 domain-containing protein [Clostridia bacterium]